MSLRSRFFIALVACCSALCGQAVPFAENGGLKMLYDNRMYPQALEHEGQVFMVWRAKSGLPHIRSYDRKSGGFSEPFSLVESMDDPLDAPKYKRDHHYAPILWNDSSGYLHVLFGCHIISGGVHLVSKQPWSIAGWRQGPAIAPSISYPKAHRLGDSENLLYFRHQGHLGYWTYRISGDDGETWTGPETPPINLSLEPYDGAHAEHAGSYHTTRVSSDGRSLHIAFIWKVEKPLFNSRYEGQLSDHTHRYNLYYLKVDLLTGKAHTYEGDELETPVRKGVADRQCLIWNTDERVAAAGPSIYLDEYDDPYFLLPVSAKTPYRSTFYFVRRGKDRWVRTAFSGTSHPFNSSHLDRADDGSFRAVLVIGEGESHSEDDMDSYGWGTRIEEWVSDPSGENWKFARNLSAEPGTKYQNIQFVSRASGERAKDLLLFYGWRETFGTGTAFLWQAGE